MSTMTWNTTGRVGLNIGRRNFITNIQLGQVFDHVSRGIPIFCHEYWENRQEISSGMYINGRAVETYWPLSTPIELPHPLASDE